MTHYCIEVTHQYGAKAFTCESFWYTALEDGLDYYELSNDEDIEDYSEYLSDNDREALKAGKSLTLIYYGDNPSFIVETSLLDKEAVGYKYLSHDLNRLIVIDTVEDADYYANKYKDHQWMSVRRLAREILETLTEEYRN